MCFGPFKPPKMPTPPPLPPLPPPPPPAPTKADPSVRKAREDSEKRAKALAGGKATIATGPRGLLTGEETGVTLLGGS